MLYWNEISTSELRKKNTAQEYYKVPIELADFGIIPIKAVRDRIFERMVIRGMGRSPLLGEGTTDQLG